MVISKCYDLAVFVDKTAAINIDLTADPDRKVGDLSADNEGRAEAGVEESIQKNMVSNNKRLMMEYRFADSLVVACRVFLPTCSGTIPPLATYR
jgi:hypothetical protein